MTAGRNNDTEPQFTPDGKAIALRLDARRRVAGLDDPGRRRRALEADQLRRRPGRAGLVARRQVDRLHRRSLPRVRHRRGGAEAHQRRPGERQAQGARRRRPLLPPLDQLGRRPAHAHPARRRGEREGRQGPDAGQLREPDLHARRRARLRVLARTARSCATSRTTTRTRPARPTPTCGPSPVDGAIKETSARNLTAKNKGWDGAPLYSPDGKSIAFISQATPAYESDLKRLALLDRQSAAVTLPHGREGLRQLDRRLPLDEGLAGTRLRGRGPRPHAALPHLRQGRQADRAAGALLPRRVGADARRTGRDLRAALDRRAGGDLHGQVRAGAGCRGLGHRQAAPDEVQRGHRGRSRLPPGAGVLVRGRRRRRCTASWSRRTASTRRRSTR